MFGPLKLNYFHGEIHLDGERLDLTLTKFKLLAMLIDKRGRVISREVLLRDIRGYTRRHKSRTADIHVHHVRGKLRHARGPREPDSSSRRAGIWSPTVCRPPRDLFTEPLGLGRRGPSPPAWWKDTFRPWGYRPKPRRRRD